jgi:hypothetical protein
MTRTRISGLILCLSAAASLGGCASFHHFAQWVRIKPVAPQAAGAHPSNRVDSYYASAKAAISRRDYAEALDLLQLARASKADDVRVLNAFGVVYDKLGRFDLSDRYYTQARALDPGSRILANNIAYSQVMRLSATPSPFAAPPIEFARDDAASGFQLASADEAAETAVPATPTHAAIIRLGFGRPAAASTISLALAGKPLEVANASGRRNGADPVVRELVKHGWTTPNLQTASARRQMRTTILYPSNGLMVANALAKTLPSGVQLVDCGQSCDGLRLVLGEDSTSWPLVARAARGQ